MMKKVFLTFGLLLFLLFGIIVYHNYSLQDQMIFKSVPLEKDHVFELEHPYEEVYLETLEKTQVHGLWFQSPDSKGVILYFHGRGKNLNSWAHRAYPFVKRGYDVFIIDYRGFGKSSCGFKESWLLEDGETAYHFLLEHYPEDKITVYGHSMGTSIATWVASTHNPHMLILEAPFFSLVTVAAYTKPFIPEFVLEWILKYHLRTDKWIQHVKAPVYIFHGVPDNIVPYEQGHRLFGKIKDNKKNEMITLPNAGHGDIPYDPIYIEKLDSILN